MSTPEFKKCHGSGENLRGAILLCDINNKITGLKMCFPGAIMWKNRKDRNNNAKLEEGEIQVLLIEDFTPGK